MRGGFWLWALVVWILGTCVAQADSYEWQRTRAMLKQQGLELADAPEGKRIAWVRVVRDDVFVKDEIWPTWFNWFHRMTRDEVVRRELLFSPGGDFHDARAEETMRNLRGMGIFALVRIVAVRTADPDQVGVVVHTRDLWSLRLEQDFNITTQVNSLLLRGTERNLFGRNKTIGADFTLVPKTYTLRQFYVARRVWGSSVTLSESAGLINNRATNNTEGSLWGLILGQPFYNLRQRYAWTLDLGYETRIMRQVQNGEVLTFAPIKGGPSAKRVWRQANTNLSLVGYVRRGQRYKQTLGAGWDYRDVFAKPIPETGLPPELRDDFERRVFPRQRRESGPLATYEIWMPTWTTFTNLATYGQSENVRTGPSAAATVRAPLGPLGSSSNSWVLSSSVGAVLAKGGGLIEARVSGSTRFEERSLVDQRFSVLVRGATPVFGVVRLVARGLIDARRNDTARTFVTLGGDNGLRGHQSQELIGYGASRMLLNLELRTLPIEWEAVHVGGVVFYDVGSVYDNWREMQVHYAVGLGLRILFPQFNRYPFSLDAGMSADPAFRLVPTFTSGQIVPLSASEDPVP